MYIKFWCDLNIIELNAFFMSGPDALDGLVFLSSFSTPSVFIVIDGIVDFRFMWVSGMLSTRPLVNTEDNCYINICAFSLLWLTSFPFSFRGATVILSCLRDFTYFQDELVLLFFIPSVMALFMYFHSSFRICLLHSFWRNL